MAELYRYAAFISYSSKDAAFARRLHRAVEAYGIPMALGTFDLLGGGGKKNRIYPVFRDREELSAGRLSDNLEAALKASGALIVVCSAAAAASPWVNKEIEFYHSLGRRDRVFTIIADNLPAHHDGEDITRELFPPALQTAGPDGVSEPIAADARKGKDGFRNAWLKLVAGLIGMNAGALLDRDRKRRRRRHANRGAAAALAALGMVAAFVSINTMRWRESLSVEAVGLLEAGFPVDAIPFALASVDLGGSAIPFHSAHSDEVLGELGAIRMLADLGSLRAMELSRDGNVLFTETRGHDGAYYGLAVDAAPISLGTIARRYDQLYLSDNGATLITYNADRTGTFYDLKNGGRARSLGDLGDLFDAQLSANGVAFVVRGRNHTVVYYDLANGSSPVNLGDMGELVTLSKLAENGRTLVVGTDAGDVILADLASGGTVRRLGNFGQGAMRWVANDAVLVLRNPDGTADSYDLLQGGVARSLGNLGDVFSMQLSRNGRTLVVVKKDRTASLYDLFGANDPRPLGDVGLLLDGQFSADGRMWVARTLADPDDIARVSRGEPPKVFAIALTFYELKGSEAPRRLDNLGPLLDAVVAANGRVLIARSPNQDMTLYSLPDQGVLRSIGKVFDWRLSADGNALFVRNADGRSALYRVDRLARSDGGRDLGKLLGPDLDPNHFAMSVDGSIIVGVSPGGLTSMFSSVSPPPHPDGAELAADVCRMSGSVIRPFPARFRDPAASAQRTVASDQAIYTILRGRPWHPCDWRGLAAGMEGWAQYWRMIQIRYLNAPDYKCEERAASGSRDPVSTARCSRMHEADAALRPD